MVKSKVDASTSQTRRGAVCSERVSGWRRAEGDFWRRRAEMENWKRRGGRRRAQSHQGKHGRLAMAMHKKSAIRSAERKEKEGLGRAEKRAERRTKAKCGRALERGKGVGARGDERGRGGRLDEC